jgi:hypothetical protein
MDACNRNISSMRMPRGGIIVDPAAIGDLLKPNLHRGKNQSTVQQSSWPAQRSMTSTSRSDFRVEKGFENACSVSEASDTTRDPDGSETESFNDSWSGEFAQSMSHKFEAPALPVTSLRPQIRKQNTARKCGFKKESHRQIVNSLCARTDNASPEAFAAAWNVASSIGAWKKKDGQQSLGNDAHPQRQKASKDAPRTGKDSKESKMDNIMCGSKKASPTKMFDRSERFAEAVPLAEASKPPQEKFAMPLPVGAINLPNNEAKHDRLAEIVASALREGLLPSSVQASNNASVPKQPKPTQTDEVAMAPLPGHCDQPLKITVPNLKCEKPNLDPYFPCKKRVPNWEL